MKDKNARDTSLKSFAENWRETGPVLDAIRSREVAALTQEQARQQTLALFGLWRPSSAGMPVSPLSLQRSRRRAHLRPRVERS